MNKYLIIPFVLIMLVITPLTGSSKTKTNSSGAIVLSMALPQPPVDPIAIEAQKMVDSFNKRANGAYVIEMHPAESVVKTFESFDAVRENVVDLAVFPAGIFASVERRFYAEEIPFIFSGPRADAAAHAMLVPEFNKFLPKKFKQRMLANISGSSMKIISNKPIRTMDDWKGVLMQSLSNQSARVINNMGGSPVSIPFTESFQALEKGTVDAVMTPAPVMIAFKLFEVSKYVTSGFFISAPMSLTINEKVFQSMPKHMQDILIDEGEKFQTSGNDYFINSEMGELQFFRDAGLEVFILPHEEWTKWRDKNQPITEEFLTKMGDFGKLTKQIADKANAQYPD